MAEPRRPTQDELLNKLLDCEDGDHAWQLAVSYVLGELIAESREMEERMRRSERMYLIGLGGLFLMTFILLPLATAFIREITL